MTQPPPLLYCNDQAHRLLEFQREITSLGLDGSSLIEQKRRYNATLPVTKIPPELVVKILGVVHAQHLMHESVSDLVEATHIFHYWRRVALNTPEFWARVPILPKDAELEMFREWIARARAVPLDIHIWRSDQTNYDESTFMRRVDAYNLVMKQLSQVRSLDLILPETLLSQLHWPCSSADLMHRLCCDVLSANPPSSFFDLFSALHSPNLADLEITNVRALWGPKFFPASLKSAIIVDQTPKPHSLVVVLENLENAPLLETLTLVDSFNFVTEPCSKLVHLPKLEDLDLSGRAPYIIELLNHITFPTHTRVSLTCRIVDSTLSLHDILTPISVLINKCFGGERILRSCHMFFNDHDLKPTLLMTCRESVEDEVPRRSTDLYVCLSLDNPEVTRTGLWHLHIEEQQIFFNSLPLKDLEELSIESWPCIRTEQLIDWLNFFAITTQKVRVLRLLADVETSNAEMFLPIILRFCALIEAVPGDLSSTRQLCVLPIVEVLDLHMFKFSATAMGSKGPSPFPDVLCAYLQKPRASARSIRITDCYDVTQQVIDDLKVAGAHNNVEVIWDGIQQAAPLLLDSDDHVEL